MQSLGPSGYPGCGGSLLATAAVTAITGSTRIRPLPSWPAARM